MMRLRDVFSQKAFLILLTNQSIMCAADPGSIIHAGSVVIPQKEVTLSLHLQPQIVLIFKGFGDYFTATYHDNLSKND